jgi:uncharacterized repeat protein (TIGR03803 family)
MAHNAGRLKMTTQRGLPRGVVGRVLDRAGSLQLHRWKRRIPPVTGPVFDQAGNLYGTALEGGRLTEPCPSAGCGTVFRLSPAATPGNPWSETILRQFRAGPDAASDGAIPYSGLIFGKGGALCGTTIEVGGSVDSRECFRSSPRDRAGSAPNREKVGSPIPSVTF